MYINLDMFREAGIEPPKSDWTMEDYIEIAGKMTKRKVIVLSNTVSV